MKNLVACILTFSLIALSGCITQFVPQTKENKEMLVVEGLITDKAGESVIKIAETMPLGEKSDANPVSGCTVYVTDNLGSSTTFYETSEGVYSPPSGFSGQVGRTYTLQIHANPASGNLNYRSFPVEMKPVPPIDSIYYEKVP